MIWDLRDARRGERLGEVGATEMLTVGGHIAGCCGGDDVDTRPCWTKPGARRNVTDHLVVDYVSTALSFAQTSDPSTTPSIHPSPTHTHGASDGRLRAHSVRHREQELGAHYLSPTSTIRRGAAGRPATVVGRRRLVVSGQRRAGEITRVAAEPDVVIQLHMGPIQRPASFILGR